MNQQQNYVLALDQGTTSTRAFVFDQYLKVVATAQKSHQQYYPHEGWVEHDPEEIWANTVEVIRHVHERAGVDVKNIVGLGITNQRETALAWSKSSGECLYPAIVWQDRRTHLDCQQLSKKLDHTHLQHITGLMWDPYFSGTKWMWMLNHVSAVQAAARSGDLMLGTIDSFLISRLTNGKSYWTDASNASRTLLMDLRSISWQPDMLDLLGIHEGMLPKIADNTEMFGMMSDDILGHPIPILASIGDQQSALIGQRCFHQGEMKCTFGTGAFALLNTGSKVFLSQHRLLSTLAYQTKKTGTVYALEGSVFMAGAIVQWLRDQLGFFPESSYSESLAEQADPNQHVMMIPAFTGLGAPYWDADARGAIVGMTRATGPKEITRAALESVALQARDLVVCMQQDTGLSPQFLKVDGGLTHNHWLMNCLAGVTGMDIVRPPCLETTVLGAAYLAGWQAGLYPAPDDLDQVFSRADQNHETTVFIPSMTTERRDFLLKQWQFWISRIATKVS